MSNSLTRKEETVEQLAAQVSAAFEEQDYVHARRLIEKARVPEATARQYGLHCHDLPQTYNKAFAIYEHLAPKDPAALSHFDKTFAGDIIPTEGLEVGAERQADKLYTRCHTGSPFEGLHLETAYTDTVPVLKEAQPLYDQFANGQMSKEQFTQEITALQGNLADRFAAYTDCYNGKDKYTRLKAEYELRETVRSTDGAILRNSGYLNGVHRGDLEILFANSVKGPQPEAIAEDIDYMASKLPESVAHAISDSSQAQTHESAHKKVDQAGVRTVLEEALSVPTISEKELQESLALNPVPIRTR